MQSRLEHDKAGGLKPGVPEAMSKQARGLMERFESLVISSGGQCPWLFGFSHPTALDVHLAVFIARMLDVGRDDIIPEKLKEYGARIMQTKEWNDVMQGRKTMIAKK